MLVINKALNKSLSVIWDQYSLGLLSVQRVSEMIKYQCQDSSNDNNKRFPAHDELRTCKTSVVRDGKH